MYKYLVKPTYMVDSKGYKFSVEDLQNEQESSNGSSSVGNIGKSKMGYNVDFTEYAGVDNKDHLQVTWKGESRSIVFDKNSILGDVLEEMMYYTCYGITSNHNRITALENSTPSEVSTYTLTKLIAATDMYGYKDYTGPTMITNLSLTDALNHLQNNIEVNKNVIQNHMAKIKSNETRINALENNPNITTQDLIENNFDIQLKEITETDDGRLTLTSKDKNTNLKTELQELDTISLGNLIRIQDIQQECSNNYSQIVNLESQMTSLDERLETVETDVTPLKNTVLGHTNTIQSLDTRTSSHSASIGQAENRLTDVELQSSTNKTDISNLTTELERHTKIKDRAFNGSDPNDASSIAYKVLILGGGQKDHLNYIYNLLIKILTYVKELNSVNGDDFEYFENQISYIIPSRKNDVDNNDRNMWE